MEESIITGFRERLEVAKQPHYNLAWFLYISLDIPVKETKDVLEKDIKIFGKMVRVYGRMDTFEALLIALGYPDLSLDSYSPLMNRILIRMAEEKKEQVQYEVLAETEYGKRILESYD